MIRIERKREPRFAIVISDHEGNELMVMDDIALEMFALYGGESLAMLLMDDTIRVAVRRS